MPLPTNMDERTKIALSSYRKLKAAMERVSELSEVEAALTMACHTEHWLSSLDPIELAHLQRAVTNASLTALCKEMVGRLVSSPLD